MVNVTEKQKWERKGRIEEIKFTLKQIYDAGKIVSDMHDFVMQICVQYNITERTAKEYIKVAEWMLHNKQ